MLTAIKINNAKRKEKAYKLYDMQGLYMLVTPSGGRLWRFKYRVDGKEKGLSFGSYPEISLTDARELRDEARKQIRVKGIDPAQLRKAKRVEVKKTEKTFEAIAGEWHEKFMPTWTPGHAETIIKRLSRDVFPWIGTRPVGEITPPELLAVLRRIESRGALETAHRIKTIAGQVFRYAVGEGWAERDPSADLKDMLPPSTPIHRASITEPRAVAGLLRSIDTYEGSFVVKSALKFQSLTFVRPGELRHAEWQEIDFESATWTIPAEKMKMKVSHIVPLSAQAIEILKELKPLTGRRGKYVFPSHRSATRPMSNNAILAALRTMGYEKDKMSGHGFRAMARTILDEVLQVRPEFIEHQLAHAVKDPLGRAYNRTKHLDERRKMMETWGRYLEGLKQGAKVIPLKKRA